MEDNKKDQEMNASENATMTDQTAAPLSLDPEDDEVAAVVTEEPAAVEEKPAMDAPAGLSLDAEDDDVPAAIVPEVEVETPAPALETEPEPTMAPAAVAEEKSTMEIPSIDTMDAPVQAAPVETSTAPTEAPIDEISTAQAALDDMTVSSTSEHDIPVIEADKTISEAAAERAEEEKEALSEQQEFEDAMQDDLPEADNGKKKKMMMAAIVVLAVGGAGAFWMMSQETTPPKMSISQTSNLEAAAPAIEDDLFASMPPMPSDSEETVNMAGNIDAIDMEGDLLLAEGDAMEVLPEISEPMLEGEMPNLTAVEFEEAPMIEEVGEEAPVLPAEEKEMPEFEDIAEATKLEERAGEAPIDPVMEEELDLAAAMAPKPIEKQENLVEEPSEAELALVAQAEELAPVMTVKTNVVEGEAPKPSERVVAESFSDKDAEAYIENLGAAAKIRPLPKKYLILRKTAERNTANASIVAAQRALNEGRLRAAVDMFETLYAENSDNERVLMGRALSYHKMKNNRKALAAYEDVLKVKPKNLEALTNMLGILRIQEPELALERLLDLYELYPSNDAIIAQLGSTYAHMKRYSKAIKFLDMAVAMKPDNLMYHYNRAITLDHMGQRTKAIAAYRRTLVLLELTEVPSQRIGISGDAIRARLASLY